MVKLTKPQKLIYNMEKFSGGSISIICGSMLCSGIREVSKLQDAVNEIYRLNSALRMRIKSDGEEPCQEVTRFERREFEVHHFNDRSELRDYAEGYARKPILLEGRLCDIKIVMLPDKYGILIRMHHIIGDAWSLALIGTQFNEIMNGNIPEAFSYEEYAVAEEKYAFSKRCQKDREFFMGQFEKFPESTYLIEKIAKTNKSKRKTFVMDRENTRRIKDYCDKMGVSVFTLFMAAFGVYYNRTHMNAERFYVGTAVLNRTTYREKNTVGMYVNTIPILIENDNEKSFRENLLLIQDKIMSSLRHQKYNYGDMLSDIRKKHGFSERLYDVVLSYQNARITGTEEAFESEWYHCGEQEESLQIHIDDRDNDGIFKIQYDYQEEKFGAYEIDMLHRHMETLLFDAISHDDKKIYELQLLTEEEQRKLLHDFNDTYADYPRDKCVHQLFEEQVRKTPDKVAVIACDKTLSYAELNEEANRIAHSLIEKGVGVGDIVAFALPRKSCLLTVMFGILKSGAAYMPIDPDYPQDRIDYMLADSEAKQFITENNIGELLCQTQYCNPIIRNDSENIAYCIYTSGSTGIPKGVIIRHKNILNTICWRINNYRSLKRIISISSVTTDTYTEDVLFSLLSNSVLILVEENKNINAIIGAIDIYEEASLMTTPTFFKSIFNGRMKNLKQVILVGEKLDGKFAEEINKERIIIHNEYGPSETTICASYGKMNGRMDNN